MDPNNSIKIPRGGRVVSAKTNDLPEEERAESEKEEPQSLGTIESPDNPR